MIEFYVVTNQGIPLFMTMIGSESSDEDVSKATLFSGVVSAINTLFNELKAGDVKYFQTTNNEFFMTLIEPFILVMIIDDRQQSMINPSLFLEKISSSFRHLLSKLSFPKDHGLIPDIQPIQKDLENAIASVYEEIKGINEEDEATKNMFESLW